MIAPFVPQCRTINFSFLRMSGKTWFCKSSTVAPGNALTFTDRSFGRFVSSIPLRIESPSITQVPGS